MENVVFSILSRCTLGGCKRISQV